MPEQSTLAAASRAYFRRMLAEARTVVPRLTADEMQAIEDHWMRELVAPEEPRRIVIDDCDRRSTKVNIDGVPPQGA